MNYTLEHNSYLTALSQSEYYAITGGGFWDGLASVIEGASTFVAGATIATAVSAMTGTTIGVAATMVVGAFCGVGAMVAGVAVVGYGVYQMCN